MIKTCAMTLILTSLIFLTACSENTISKNEPGLTTGTLTHNTAIDLSQSQDTETKQPKDTNFKAELTFDPKSVEDQLSENERPALDVLEKNLTALVKHDHEAFKAGFVDEKLADTLGFYYGEHLQYKFTGIENIESFTSPKNQVHIFVLGERLDITTDTIEDIKLMYAIRQSDRGDWSIYTID